MKGFRVGEAVEVIPPSWPSRGHSSVQKWSKSTAIQALDWELSCLELSRKIYGVSCTLLEAHWRTMVGDIVSKEKHTFGAQQYVLFKRHLAGISMGLGHILAGLDSLSITEDFPVDVPESELEMLIRYSAAVTGACEGHCFFTTKGGRIGLGPPHVRPADQICIFYGGHTPYIVRSRDAGRGCHEFIGEIYTHGLMYGEAFKET